MLLPWLAVAVAAASDDPDRAGDRAAGREALELASRLVEEVGPRPAGSPGAAEAQRWVARELKARGWAPGTLRPERWASVVACRPGASERVVLFLAHTDAVHGRVPGANDNAAAVAVLLSAASRIGERPPRTVCLAFPDAEEIGLRGSVELARVARRELGPLDQVVSLDLVGRGTLTHHGLGPVFGPARLRALLEAAPADVPWVYRGISQAWPMMERSDHLPFTLLGLPASHLMARAESGVDWGYHSVRDTPERLQVDTLDDAVGAVVGIAGAPPLPDEEGEPAFVVPRTGLVVGGWGAWGLLALGLVAAPLGLRGPRPAVRELGWGAGSWLLRTILASGAAGLGIAAAAAGRPWDMALAGPAVVAGWACWALVVTSWPAIPAPVARAFGAAVALGTAALLLPAPLLAVPFAVAAACVGLSGPGIGRVVALGALAPAAYLLRPDAVRELAFHGLVPATVWIWTLIWAVVSAPVLGTVHDLEGGPRRVLGAVWALVLVGALLWGWSGAVEAEPWVRGTVLWPGAP